MTQASQERRRRRGHRPQIAPCDPVCVECGKLGQLVTGDRIYPHRMDLHGKSFFLCECGAYVGCHPGTQLALGRPAGSATRGARNNAHRVFDDLWRRKMNRDGVTKSVARNAAYAWLASTLGYEPGRCHIAWMTADEAKAVVRVCHPYIQGKAA